VNILVCENVGENRRFLILFREDVRCAVQGLQNNICAGRRKFVKNKAELV